ncbi:Hypothetical predicted protein [Cloeon dipterum]|uniref:GCN5-related N-acetyltransferase Rv2170-like domain-containing protein n=1 Tax=Cloeon dipterum TaxID=197152 RepID=A0A8S1C4V0_9INSE|nr:Hypothetical predicted protein [Cloeon dipterum]
MQPEKAIHISIPRLLPNVRVRQLDESFLDVVCDNWPHYDFQYRPVVLKMLQLNHSVGVFVKTGNDEEQLASMVLQGEYGGLGLLQTLTEHQRKGYAEIATASLTKTLGMEGIMPHGARCRMDQLPNEMSSKYALQPLAKSQIPKLLETLKSLLPDSIIAYHWLLNGSRWIDGHGLDSKILILCPNGDTNDGSMVGLIDGLAGHNKIFGTVYVQPENMDKMKIAIKETEHIEWERLKHLIGVWRRFVPHLTEVMKAKGVEFTENYRTVNAMTILKAASLPSPKKHSSWPFGWKSFGCFLR